MNARVFLPAEIQSAEFCDPPAFSFRPRLRTGRRAAGMRYESRVQARLCSESEWYLPSPWIVFLSGGKPYWCQPDGLHFAFDSGVITVIEVKNSHTSEAYRQLRCVYAPVLARMFPPRLWTLRLVELVKWYDPDVDFPETTVMCPDPFAHRFDAIGVHIWHPGHDQ
jgi:hypothetical protein